MPLFNYGQPFGQAPGYSPGGRSINPQTARIAGLPGGMDYLAGFGPAPAGVTDTPEWTNVVPKRLGSVGGADNPMAAFMLGAQRFGAPRQNSIDAFNNKYGTNITAQLLGFSGPNTSAIPSLAHPSAVQSPMLSLQQFNNPQTQADLLSQSQTISPNITNPAAIASLTRSAYGVELPQTPITGTTTLASGRQVPGGTMVPQTNADLGFGVNQNPYVPSWGTPGLVYGFNKGTRHY